MIEKIAHDRRPSPSLIKLIESVGFLLGVPLSKKKSAYKAPLPSNYDQTLQLLLDDFYGTVVRLSRMQSADLDNEVALNLYRRCGFEIITQYDYHALDLRRLGGG